MFHIREPATRRDIRQLAIQHPEEISLPEDLDLTDSCVMVLPDGKLLGAAGVTPLFEKTGEVWSVFMPSFAKDYPISLTKVSRKMLDKWQGSGKYPRLSSFTLNDPTYTEWLIVLGYEFEGILKNFGPGAKEDWCVLGRVV